MNPVFTIIIPVYKVEKYIAQCMESVVNQTFEDFEAICVDDCGGDNSAKIIQEYVDSDKRIKLVHHKKNRGLSAARNTALELARGEYIVCLDSDDWLEENCLEVLYEEFNKRKTNSIWFDAYKYEEHNQKRSSELVSGNRAGFLTITPQNIATCTDYSWIKAYKTSSIKDNNIDWPEGLTFEDGEFYFKYFSLNPQTYIIENCLYNYRIREGSIVTNAQAGNAKIQDIYQVVRNIRDFYIERRLYEKYKKSLLQLMNMRINTCRNIRNNYRKSLGLSNSMIKDFGFPNEFEDFNQDVNPVFSVIVPIYNVEKYIEQCLISIQSQSFNNIEILCIDDCGKDKSMEIVEKFAKEDKRIKIIKHSENKGLGAARNTALRAARGKYIVCVDSDDWMLPQCLETVYQKFKETGLNTIWYKANFWWENQNFMSNMSPFPVLLNAKEGFITLDGENLATYPMYAWNKAFNREFLLENEIFWSEGVLFEDMEFGFKAGIKSPQIYLIDKALYVYRRRGDSIIGCCTNDYKKAEDVFKVSESVYNYLKENNLLEKYKKTFLHYAVDNINMFRGFPNIQKKLSPKINKFIEKINLSEEIWKEI